MGDQALYEAFIALKSKKDPKAYEAGEQLLLQHSKSKYSREVVNAMGQMALLTADFRRAAIYFELFYDRYPDEAGVKDLLKNAAQIREQMGDFKLAARDYQKLGDFDKTARQDFIAGDWAALIRSSARTSGINPAYYEGLAQYRLRGLGPARGLLEKAAAYHSNNYEDQEKAAHALYLLSMAAMASYRDIQMHAGQETKDVQQKSGLLTDLEAKLKAVIAFGNGRWTIAALYGLGLANKEFADFIKKAPLPPGLTPDQQKQFQTVLATKANQYDNSAHDYFDQCQTNAEKYEVLTRFALGCQSQGTLKVDEAQEVTITTQASETEPSGAGEVRKKLFDDPRNVRLLFQLSDLYFKAKDFAAAELVLSRASEIDPANKNCIARLGVIKLHKNELAEAKALFEKATAAPPVDALGYWGLAGLYHQFHFDKKFKETLAKARAAGRPNGPGHPFIDKILN
jgi:tetratricopeptide (TPR) repeat protein